jgi:hypothetical protein
MIARGKDLRTTLHGVVDGGIADDFQNRIRLFKEKTKKINGDCGFRIAESKK